MYCVRLVMVVTDSGRILFGIHSCQPWVFYLVKRLYILHVLGNLLNTFPCRMTCVPTFSPGARDGYFSMQPSTCGYGLPENSQMLSLGVSNACYPLVEDLDPNIKTINLACDLCDSDKLTINVKYYHPNEAPSHKFKYVPIKDPTEERKRICGLSKVRFCLKLSKCLFFFFRITVMKFGTLFPPAQ